MDRIRELRRTLALVRHSREELAEPGPGLVLHGKELTPTPIYISRRTRLILLAALVLALAWLAREAPSIPRLLLLGSTVALVLSFPVRVLGAFLPRGIAILIVIGSSIALSILAMILLVPFMVAEISRFVTNLPLTADATQNVVRDVLMEFRKRGWMEQNPDALIADIRANLINRGEALVQTLLSNLLVTLTQTLATVLTVFGILFIATYLLIDIPRFRENFIHAFSPPYRDDAALLWFTVGDSLSRYLAGLLVSIVIQGTLATIGLSLLGIPYALVLGLWMSLTAILPYIGAFLGAIPSVLIALTISPETAVLVTALYIGINLLEGNLITPRVQGEAVRVHPLLIFIAIIAGGEIAGVLGAILAVPILAVARVLVEFFWVRLRTRYPEDTVLTALGGTGNGEDTGSEADDGDSDEVLIEVDAETEAEAEPTSPPVRNEAAVRVAANRRTPVTRHRRRPPVRRRRKALV